MEKSAWRKQTTDEIPVPGISANTGARILERLVLETLRREANLSAIGKQTQSIDRDQMRHWLPPVYMPVQPKAAVHGERHSRFSIVHELAIPTRQSRASKVL